MTENGGEVLKTLSKKGLLKAVIEKHDRLIAEYDSEFKALDGKVSKLKEKLASSKKEHEDTLQRIEVLREKRQQLYYQAKKVLEDIEPGIIENKLLHSIHDDIEELKRIKDAGKETELHEIVSGKIGSIEIAAIKEQIAQLSERVREAGEATRELLSLEEGQKDFDEKYERMVEELKNDEPRHNWLHRRISSHKEARAYWEKQAEEYEKTEGAA